MFGVPVIANYRCNATTVDAVINIALGTFFPIIFYKVTDKRCMISCPRFTFIQANACAKEITENFIELASRHNEKQVLYWPRSGAHNGKKDFAQKQRHRLSLRWRVLEQNNNQFNVVVAQEKRRDKLKASKKTIR